MRCLCGRESCNICQTKKAIKLHNYCKSFKRQQNLLMSQRKKYHRSYHKAKKAKLEIEAIEKSVTNKLKSRLTVRKISSDMKASLTPFILGEDEC